jgi:hypothetical protein
MKRLLLTGVVTLTFALGAFAQGIIDLDNSANANRVETNTGGDIYTGTYGMEVWELSPPPWSAEAVVAGIDIFDAAPVWGYGLWAYNQMEADGFKKEATFANQTMTDGTFSLGNLTMPDVTPAGSTVVLALAVWTTSQPNWSAMVAHAVRGATCCGVIAFMNPTGNPEVSPPSAPNLTGWTPNIGDLAMMSIPEPGTLALAGLGVAALLIFRRRP